MMKKLVIITCIAIVLVYTNKTDIATAQTGPYKASWETLKKIPVPQWFDDAKFGIFIHWGPYSVMGYQHSGKGYAEHTPKFIYRIPERHYSFLKDNYGAHPPEFGYKDIVPLFKAEKWDPDEWADLFHKAGAKYVVLTAEHHDGYAMWDSDLTPWSATKIGPRRDLVGDLGKAVRKRGMKYAPSYHRERHTGFFTLDLNAVHSQPHPDIAAEIERMPEAAELYGPFEISDAFIEDYVARWKEIQEKYRPDFMWLDHFPVFHGQWNKDFNHPQIQKFRTACMHMITDYFNAAEKWGKEVYLNNKGPEGGRNWPEGIGCMERDNMHLDAIGPKWQNPATLGTSFGYLKVEEEQDAYKSPTELIHLLCDVVSKNGNLLLNIGPRADGTIPAGMQKRLLEMGKWLSLNGEAIYGTKPWNTFGQEDPQIRFTYKDGILYAIVLEELNEPFLITSIKDLQSCQSVKLLGSNNVTGWEITTNGLLINPPDLVGEHAWVYKIKLNLKM